MTAPSYKTHDPRGWGGDPRRGAALGRPTVRDHDSDFADRIYLRRIRIDSGGYDPNGTYYGIGEPLYWAASEDNDIDFTFRAGSRDEAVAKVREHYPKAKIRK